MFDNDDLLRLAARLENSPTFAELEKAALAIRLLCSTNKTLAETIAQVSQGKPSSDGRVTALLEANNREVERRRAAEAKARSAEDLIRSLMRKSPTAFIKMTVDDSLVTVKQKEEGA